MFLSYDANETRYPFQDSISHTHKIHHSAGTQGAVSPNRSFHVDDSQWHNENTWNFNKLVLTIEHLVPFPSRPASLHSSHDPRSAPGILLRSYVGALQSTVSQIIPLYHHLSGRHADTAIYWYARIARDNSPWCYVRRIIIPFHLRQ